MLTIDDIEKFIRRYKLIKYYGVEHNKDLLPLHIFNIIDSLFGAIPTKSNIRPKFINYCKDNKVIFGHVEKNGIGIYVSKHILETTFGGTELIIFLMELLYKTKFIYVIKTTFEENY